MSKDHRWLSFAVACAAVSVAFMALAMIIELTAGVTAYAFTMTLMMFGLFLMVPGVFALLHAYRGHLIAKGRIQPKERKLAKQKANIQFEYVQVAMPKEITPVLTEDGEFVAPTPTQAKAAISAPSTTTTQKKPAPVLTKKSLKPAVLFILLGLGFVIGGIFLYTLPNMGMLGIVVAIIGALPLLLGLVMFMKRRGNNKKVAKAPAPQSTSEPVVEPIAQPESIAPAPQPVVAPLPPRMPTPPPLPPQMPQAAPAPSTRLVKYIARFRGKQFRSKY